MLFNSYPFIFVYLPIVFAAFFLTAKYISHRAATFTLVLASFVFYGYWDVKYVPLLFGSICFNYFIGRQLDKHTKSKFWLVVGLSINILLLGYFKYTDFFLTTINDISGAQVFDLPHIVLPLGISFFTFTQSAYLVDTYRKEAAPHNFLTYCEFVTIFPHLIAGPIINHKEMIPQFIDEKTFHIDYKNIALGLTIFTFGLFKKVVIADKLAIWANETFNHVDVLTCTEAWIGALSYTLQLYFDFSGYSEMAIGLALLFNLKMPINFNSPYQARSIIDFWRRWHMTLGLWVKNYLYIPMGGNRHGELSKMRNLFVSMLIIGLWHGAGWTFVIWGGLHGLLLMINHQWRRLNINLPKVLNWGMTFLCVMICWVFFRAESFDSAIFVLKNMASFSNVSALGIRRLITICIIISGVIIIPNPLVMIKHFSTNNKWLVMVCFLFVVSIFFIAGTGTGEFLYFQF